MKIQTDYNCIILNVLVINWKVINQWFTELVYGTVEQMDDVQMQLHVIFEIFKNAIASKDHSFAADSNWFITFDLAGILDKNIRVSAVDMKHI